MKRFLIACLLLASPAYAADSYNDLFGLGAHSEDASLVGWWLLGDDAASTTIVDESSNSNDGVLVGGRDTEVLAAASPNSWLPGSLSMNGTADSIELLQSGHAIGRDCTYLLRTYLDSAASGTSQEFSALIGTGDNNISVGRNSTPAVRLRWSASTQVTSGTVSEDAWLTVGCTVFGSAGGTNEFLYLNGSSVGSFNNSIGLQSDDDLVVGHDQDLSRYALARMAEAVAFSRNLSAAEVANWHAGPELNYSSGASLAANGAYNVGTWALPAPFASGSNGTATYVVSAVNAAGDVLGSDTTASGTIDISSEEGNTVYLVVRASNTGGYDVGDYATRTSGFGSAGDGYYEIASVTAGGGGGGPTVPVLMHHYKGLR